LKHSNAYDIIQITYAFVQFLLNSLVAANTANMIFAALNMLL